jgi:hypothetical protein
MKRISRHGRRWPVAALVLVLVLVAAACSGDGDSADTTSAAASGEVAGEPAAVEPPSPESPATEDRAGDGADLGSGGVEAVVQPIDLGRDIIFTADLTVAVSDVAAAGNEATLVIESLGGFVFGQQTTGAPEPRSVLTFKIAPESFQTALARLGDIGDVRTQNVTTDDVTERVVDLQSRITTAEASVERLRGFLENAQSINAIAELERELLQRETDLETLRGQLRTIRDRVDLATIVLTLTERSSEPRLRVDATVYPGHDGGTSCPGDPELSVDEGSDVTFCLELVNRGDSGLTEFELREPVFDLEIGDMTVVFGDLESVLEPGQSIVLASDQTVERTTRPQARITATAVDEDGQRIASRTVSTTATAFIEAVDPGGPPSFRDGLTGAVDFLATVGRFLVFLFGVLVPFLPVVAAAWLLWIWRRRRDHAAAAALAADGDTRAGPEPTAAGDVEA